MEYLKLVELQKENAELRRQLVQNKIAENINISELKIPINVPSEVTTYLTSPSERVVKVIIVAEKY